MASAGTRSQFSIRLAMISSLGRDGMSSARSIAEVLMERDVVCEMEVDTANAPASSHYNGKTYYFCCKECKTKFDADPTQFTK